MDHAMKVSVRYRRIAREQDAPRISEMESSARNAGMVGKGSFVTAPRLRHQVHLLIQELGRVQHPDN